MGSNQLVHNNCVADRRVECLVPTSLVIIDVFTNDFPIAWCEGFMTKDLIGVPKPVENESAFVSAVLHKVWGTINGSSILVCESLTVYYSKRCCQRIPH